MPHSPEHLHKGIGEARNQPIWRDNDYTSISGAYTYRDSATPITDAAHEADPENVQPAEMHVVMNSYRHIPQGYSAYIKRGNEVMAPGRTEGGGMWGFRTIRRAQIAAESMMNRINKHGDDKYLPKYDDDSEDPF